MPSTPEPVAQRARTPPTPLHGPQYDNYEPYSPRRSKRTTAQSNPYSSFNSERSPHASFQTTPPATVKKARFARAPTQLSSPPSSPASPNKQRRSLHKTPLSKKQHSRKAVNGAHSDSDGPGPSHRGASNSLAPPVIDPITMLPTPSKTPKKRSHHAAIHSTARVLSFQPEHPNDVMPSPRKIKKSHARSLKSQGGFELWDEEMAQGRDGEIEIYTDANARVPVLDESEDNPFVGERVVETRPQRRSKDRMSEGEREMDEKAKRGEGMVYVFRGKKMFRRYSKDNPHTHGSDAEDAASDISASSDQRRLKHQAGAAAQRPLTRSAIKPRLLFPTEEQLREREQGPDDVDEEAVTDIEMDNQPQIPANNSTPISPPSTNKKKSRAGPKFAADSTPVPIYEDEVQDDPMSLGTNSSFSSVDAGKGKGKSAATASPFDAWQRTKSSRKRMIESAGGEEGVGGSKRTRKQAGGSFEESPAGSM